MDKPGGQDFFREEVMKLGPALVNPE